VDVDVDVDVDTAVCEVLELDVSDDVEDSDVDVESEVLAGDAVEAEEGGVLAELVVDENVGTAAPAPMTGTKGAFPSAWGNGERFLIRRLRPTWSRCWWDGKSFASEEVARLKTRAKQIKSVRVKLKFFKDIGR